jgi:hypothetical protein
MKLAPASGERTGEQGLFSFNKSNRNVLSDVVVFTFSRKNECQRLALQVHLYCQRLALQVLLLPALVASCSHFQRKRFKEDITSAGRFKN